MAALLVSPELLVLLVLLPLSLLLIKVVTKLSNSSNSSRISHNRVNRGGDVVLGGEGRSKGDLGLAVADHFSGDETVVAVDIGFVATRGGLQGC